jgi:ribose 5-phosphate isomerase A
VTQAKHLIRFHELCLGDLEEFPAIDVTIDGADEVDQDKVLIKGGGGCLTQEKIIAAASHKLVIVADHSKKSVRLGQNWKKGIPIEVIPMAFNFVRTKIHSQFGGKATLRHAKMKAGPVVTDNSNFILDWVFDPAKNYIWSEVETALNMIPGVVENGLFIDMAQKVYFGEPDGSVSII